jgi:hypothetical protein
MAPRRSSSAGSSSLEEPSRPRLTVDTGAAIANKSGAPAAVLARPGGGTGYSPRYTPTNAYFEGKFGGESMRAPGWVVWWMLIASVVVAIDSLYSLCTYYKAQQYIPAVVAQLWGLYGTTDTQYAASGAGVTASNGWMPTQSHFNLLEVALQLLFLRLHAQRSSQALSVAYFVSVATLWKTLMYMGIIAFANKPFEVLPALQCVLVPGYAAKPGEYTESEPHPTRPRSTNH